MKFNFCFHGTNLDPTMGLSKLHSLLLRDLIEAEELLQLFKARIGLEMNYSSRLLEIKHAQLSQNGFRKDESRLSSVVFLKYKTEMVNERL